MSGAADEHDVQAREWVGHAIVGVLGLDSSDKGVRARIGGGGVRLAPNAAIRSASTSRRATSRMS
jgi:hypothetical protein